MASDDRATCSCPREHVRVPFRPAATATHGEAVLEAYVSLRRATARLGTLDQAVRAALMLASAVAAENRYAVAVLSMLAFCRKRPVSHPAQRYSPKVVTSAPGKPAFRRRPGGQADPFVFEPLVALYRALLKWSWGSR
jgi:hypothetical protein